MPPRRSSWAINLCILLAVAQNSSAQQFSPLIANSESECALLLEGPGRTSAFDYNLNALRGTFGYGGQHTCITYDAINQAYIQARKRINVAQPKNPMWKTEEIATVGELLLDVSINLAKTYGLSYEDIEKGLPLIDTSKTLIREVCPPFLANVECRPGKYRRYDGLCSNLQHPTWGATMTPFTRLVGPLYADGMTAPRISVTGNQLPLPRIVSRTVHPDEGFHDHAGTVMVVAWGQFMDHDYTLTATPLDPLNRNEPEECCNRPAHLKNPYCLEIQIPADDYFYSLFGLRCQDFVRGFPAVRPGCRLGSRSQFNTLTGVLDGNTVYGVSEKFSRHLRAGYGGLMRMNPVFSEYGLKDLLPLKLDIPDEGCTRPNRSMYCFEGGEIRVNEQLVLTCMHTLMAREHNRVAHALSQINPHWDDETVYQEARRIVIAEIQHITYNEFLPIILGKEVMEKFGLLTQKEGYWDGYDSNVNPNVIDAFAAAAFRFGHSLLPTAIERWSKAHKFIASRRLSDLIRQPYDLYRAGVLDEYFMGLMNQVAQAMDDSVTQEVTNHLFKKPGARFGMDLASFNMQRGREFGLPGYMEFRKFCGLPGANTFDELFGSMSNETIRRYASIYEHPSDVDLWSGGVSERPLPGSMVGPTFACIIATQYSYSRRGDRFWYELGNQPSSFTPEQLQEIRKAKLSRVICDNTDLIDTIQVYPMVLPDHEINPRVPCRSGIIPGIDLTKWADFNAQAATPGATPFNQTDNNLLSYSMQQQNQQSQSEPHQQQFQSPEVQQHQPQKQMPQFLPSQLHQHQPQQHLTPQPQPMSESEPLPHTQNNPQQQHNQPQLFNNNAEQNCDFKPSSLPHLDVVQSIEIHSYEDTMIAAPSHQTIEDNTIDETTIKNNTVENNVGEKTLTSENENEIKRFKRETAEEEITNLQATHLYKPKNKLKGRKTVHVTAYKLSKLSTGYKTKINPSIPPLERSPINTVRIPRSAQISATDDVSEEDVTENTNDYQYEDTYQPPEQIENGEEKSYVMENIKDNAHDKEIDKSVEPQRGDKTSRERKNIKMYQVYENSEDEPNQESEIMTYLSKNKNTRHAHKRKSIALEDLTETDKNRNLNATKLSGQDEIPIDPSTHITKDIMIEKISPTITEGEQRYGDMEKNSDHIRISVANSHSNLDQNQRQRHIDTSRQKSTKPSESQTHHLLGNKNSNKEESYEDDELTSLEYKTNKDSYKPLKQQEDIEESPFKDYMDEYSSSDYSLDTKHTSDQAEAKNISESTNDTTDQDKTTKLIFNEGTFVQEDMHTSSTPDSFDGGAKTEPVLNSEETEVEVKQNGQGFDYDYEAPVLNNGNSRYGQYNEDNIKEKQHGALKTEFVKEDYSQSQNKEQGSHSPNKNEDVKEDTIEGDEEQGGIYEAISKILEKKDAISREDDVVRRGDNENINKKEAESYRNFWVLEYSRPRPSE